MPKHQEQVPRKQGLKLIPIPAREVISCHQEQVPRKQGLKPEALDSGNDSVNVIKSKFHENKD